MKIPSKENQEQFLINCFIWAKNHTEDPSFVEYGNSIRTRFLAKVKKISTARRIKIDEKNICVAPDNTEQAELTLEMMVFFGEALLATKELLDRSGIFHQQLFDMIISIRSAVDPIKPFLQVKCKEIKVFSWIDFIEETYSKSFNSLQK